MKNRITPLIKIAYIKWIASILFSQSVLALPILQSVASASGILAEAASVSTINAKTVSGDGGDTHEKLLNLRHILPESALVKDVGKIFAIEQDKQGNLWLGGGLGIARFDGVELKVFSHQFVGKNSRPVNSVYSMQCDLKGNLWIATDSELVLFNPASETFSPADYSSVNDKTATYPSMSRGSDNGVWLINGSGVFYLNSDTHDILTILKTDDPSGPLYRRELRTVFEDSRRRLWISTVGNEILVFDNKMELLKSWTNNPDGAARVTDIHFMEDDRGQIWEVGRGVGIFRISKDLQEVTQFAAGSKAGQLPSNDVVGIVQDVVGTIWLAIDHAGLTKFNPATETFEVIKHSTYDRLSPASDQPQQLFLDADGGIWVVQYQNGVDYIGAASLNIARYLHDPSVKGSISNNMILYIYEDKTQRIWIGTEKGINLLDPKTRKVQEIEGDQNNSVITSIAENKDQTIWAGSWSDGLYRLNLQGEIIQHLTAHNGLLGTFIWSLLTDSSGQLWIGTGTLGLASYNALTGTFKYYESDRTKQNSISANLVWAILELDADSLLVATDNGLNHFHKTSGLFDRIGENSPFFKGQNIRSMIKLRNGQIWVAPRGGGITVLDQNLIPIANIGVKAGLPSHTVSGLAEDQNGMVWATTLEGAVYINPNTLTMKTLTKEQGLTGNYFNRNAVVVDHLGAVYLGSADGLSVIAPQSLDQGTPESAAKINRLTIHNREITQNRSGPTPEDSEVNEFVLERSMLATDSISLGYRDSLIGLGFSTTNLRGGKDIRFRYQLEGIDKNWVLATVERTAIYTNLKSGNYVFKVQAGDQKQFWPESEDQLKIEISPPPWLGKKAKIGYFLALCLALVLSIVYIRLHQRRLEAERTLKMKSGFLAIMSHEVRTPLTGVIGMLQIALRRNNVAPKTVQQIKQAYISAQALMNITDDILNMDKIEKEGVTIENKNFNLMNMLKTATAVFLEIAENKGLLLNFFVADDVPKMIVADPNRIRQVLSNFVGNALKFTEQGAISIYVRKRIWLADQKWALEFDVTDTGVGISPGNLAKLFEKFEQAEVSTTRIYGGSGLGLSICKTLVAAMGGKVSAESREGHGSVFTFVVPFTEGVETEEEIAFEFNGQPRYQLSILCAEDSKTNQVIIRHLVEEMGHEIAMVENGIAAIEALALNHYDLILMDGRMPKMDGTEAINHIRAGLWSGIAIKQKDIPIIALTANITQADRSGYVAAGVNAVVGKPINKTELLGAIENVIQILLAGGSLLTAREAPIINAVNSITNIESK